MSFLLIAVGGMLIGGSAKGTLDKSKRRPLKEHTPVYLRGHHGA